MSKLKIAIIGSGPTGFYTVAALLKAKADAEIDVIDSLPTPYGLVRGGVAPDHQSTKNVMRAYEKSATSDGVAFMGNVMVGRDVSLDELRELYDAVVLCIGSPLDNPLDIPGADKRGVMGAAAFVGWYNAHPDFVHLSDQLIPLLSQAETVAVIGAGNVAIDVARVLSRTEEELAATDIADYAAEAIVNSPIKDIHMIARRDAAHAKFTLQELREMGELQGAAPVIDPLQLEGLEFDHLDAKAQRVGHKNVEILRGFTEIADDGSKRRRVHFDFNLSPVEVLGGDSVTGLTLMRNRTETGKVVATGETSSLDCSMVLTAIGYRGSPLEGAPFNDKWGTFEHDDGRVGPGLYAGGWCKRGPTGVIGTNKHDGDHTAKQILADLSPSSKRGRDGLSDLLKERNVRVVSFEDWKVIEAAEISGATPPAPRKKFVTVDEMLAVLG